MLLSSDLWHCLNISSLHHNTKYTFPNIILPVLDQSLSTLGAVINTFLILTIHVKGKRSGAINLSSICHVNICLANLVECANCVLIYKSNEHDEKLPGLNVNYYLCLASGVQDVTHFVRIEFMLPVYLIRLLYIVSPSSLLNMCGERGMTRGKIYCITIWTLGIGIGAFGTYARTVITIYNDVTIQQISSYLLIVNEISHVVGMTVSLSTILYLVSLFFKYKIKLRANINTDSDATDPHDHDLPNVDQENMMYRSVKSALHSLLLFYLADLTSCGYLTLLTITVMKAQFTPGCYPAVYVLIKNYLGTTTNFVYSYHCLGVLYGICICVILLFQNTMRQTVKYMWGNGGLLAMNVVERIRQGFRTSSYSQYYV